MALTQIIYIYKKVIYVDNDENIKFFEKNLIDIAIKDS